MDLMAVGNKTADFLKKNRYVLLVLLLGLVLMIVPGHKTEKETPQAAPTTPAEENLSMSQELSELLSQIEGAGKVKVLLTVSQGERTIYQSDQSGYSSGGMDRSTVIVTDENRSQSGLIQQVLPPVYQGAIILCQGADRSAVRLAVTEAVCKATGLGADRISVLKMK